MRDSAVATTFSSPSEDNARGRPVGFTAVPAAARFNCRATGDKPRPRRTAISVGRMPRSVHLHISPNSVVVKCVYPIAWRAIALREAARAASVQRPVRPGICRPLEPRAPTSSGPDLSWLHRWLRGGRRPSPSRSMDEILPVETDGSLARGHAAFRPDPHTPMLNVGGFAVQGEDSRMDENLPAPTLRGGSGDATPPPAIMCA